MQKLIFFSLLFSTLLFADDSLRDPSPLGVPKEDIATIYPSNSQNVLLRGIYITNEYQETSESFSGIRIHMEIPKGKRILVKKLYGYLGKTLTDSLIKKIKEEIIQNYQKQNRPIVAVIIPDQDVSLGVLQVVIIEGKVGKIDVQGTQWTNEKKIRKELRFSPNEPIDENLLLQDIYWLNRNPFRQAYVVYSPGEKQGLTDIEIRVKDRCPFRLYAGVDDLGNDITGNTRLFTGLNIGNLFGNQLFSYQFTTDNEFKRFMAHSAYYKAPLPWRNELVLFGGYSSVKAKYHVGSDPILFHSKGFSTQASMRYIVPLHPWKHVLSEFTFGFDFKRTNNSLAYGVISLFPFGHFANLTQVMAGYNLGYSKDIIVSFEIEGYWSPGKWISDQTSTDYNSIRYGAKSKYAYARSAFSLIYPCYKELTWKNYLRWQVSNRNLLPSEEYGLGGFDTIRGYTEREINVDHAVVYNTELHNSWHGLFNKKQKKDSIDLFLFVDLGYGVKNQKAPGEKKDYFLASCGPGLRYNMTPYFSARLEYGRQLHDLKSSGFDHLNHRLHFSLIGGF